MKNNLLVSLSVWFLVSVAVNYVSGGGDFVNFGQLKNPSSCAVYTSSEYGYVNFIDFDTLKYGFSNSDGVIKFETFVLGKRDVNIFFSTKPRMNNTQAYEVVVAGSSYNVIVKKKNNTHTDLQMGPRNELAPNQLYKINVEITLEGKITVFLDDKELLTATDSDPIKKLQYVSFATWKELPMLYFFNCSDSSPSSTDESNNNNNYYDNHDLLYLSKL